MIRKLILFVLSLSFLTGVANAGIVTITGTAQATIINGIVMEITTPLNLGTIIIGTRAGDAEMDGNGSMDNVGGGNHIFLGDSTLGILTIMGTPGSTVNLSIRNGNEWISGPNALSGAVVLVANSITLGSNGQGGTALRAGIALQTNTPSGVYKTTFEIAANY